MLTREIILNKIEQNLETIKKYSVKRIGLFGSYVKNKQTKKSDIDIVVEFKKGKKTFDNYMELKLGSLPYLIARKVGSAHFSNKTLISHIIPFLGKSCKLNN